MSAPDVSLADPARVKPVDRRCPDKCPWGTHPENAAWQKCGVHDCQIERPAPGQQGNQ